jgi:hypothetical protein
MHESFSLGVSTIKLAFINPHCHDVPATKAPLEQLGMKMLRTLMSSIKYSLAFLRLY